MNCLKCNGLIISELLPHKQALKKRDTMWKCINCGFRMFEKVREQVNERAIYS